MSHARWITADVFDGLAQLDDNSVDLVMSSPPFLAVRSYLPADSPLKAHEIGSEPTPGAFIDVMLAVVAACERVLAPHGSLVFELGDTYAGSGGAGGDYNENGLRDGQAKVKGSAHKANTTRYTYGVKDGGRVDSGPSESQVRNGGGPGWPLAKSKCLIPEAFALSLAYGRNVITGAPSPAGQWRVRNVIAWLRTNPPVGALGDKFRPAHSELIVATQATDRWFDDLPTRRAHSEDAIKHPRNLRAANRTTGSRQDDGLPMTSPGHPAGAPLRDWWDEIEMLLDAAPADLDNRHRAQWVRKRLEDTYSADHWLINNSGFDGAHYATFPIELCIPVVQSMCPERVCTVCGQPSRRVVETTHDKDEQRRRRELGMKRGNASRADGGMGCSFLPTEIVHLGWTDCGHDSWRRGVTLDPFAGTGTTLAAATGLGRDAIGIDLDPRNLDYAYERLGMFLEAS